MAEVKDQSYFYTGGEYHTIGPKFGRLTSDKEGSEERRRITSDLGTSAEGNKKISLEELADLVITYVPNIELLTREEINTIKNESAETGAIIAHLDSMNELLIKLDKTLDDAFEKFDSIKTKF